MRAGRSQVLIGGLLSVMLVLTACESSSAALPGSDAGPIVTSTSPAPTDVAGPCGWRSAPPPTYDHVLWIMFENRSYDDIVGVPELPTFTKLAQQCGVARQFSNETHPSLPNYIAAFTGTTGGLTRDCEPTECPVAAQTLLEQLNQAAKSWRVYADSMPRNCDLNDSDNYKVYHTVVPYFPALAGNCSEMMMPMGTPEAGPLHEALTSGNLPSFSFLVPDQCHNMHDCSAVEGDKWLGSWLPRILGSPNYADGRTAVIITWDEGEGGSDGQNCLNKAGEASCHPPTFVISPSTRPGTNSDTPFNHYSVLRTTEDMLGLNGHLNHAAEAVSMRSDFTM